MNRDVKQVLQLAVVVFAALATGGLMVNWIGLGRAMSRLSRTGLPCSRLSCESMNSLLV
jgi:hypothetical protein